MLFTEYEVVYVEYTCVWQCIVLAVRELLGAVYCTVYAGGLQHVWGWGDGECMGVGE